jgi:site-specific recombinase XerC
MNSGTGLIAPLVQSFFTDHLVRQRRASPHTVASYRDTFRLLIQHLSQTTGKKPSEYICRPSIARFRPSRAR